LLNGGAKPQVLISGLSDVTRAGHVYLHSVHDNEQAQLLDDGLAGAVSTTPGPFAQAVIVNAAGSKLDSWLTQKLTYRVEKCTSSERLVTLTVALRNDAPKTGLPDYVTIRSDFPPVPVPKGQNRLDLQVLVTRGAKLISSTLDGVALTDSPADGTLPEELPDGPSPVFLDTAQTLGRPAYGVDLEMPPGGITRTLVLHLQEPPSTAEPLLPVQTMVKPAQVDVDLSSCS
jgi:hypothetical protein